MEEIDVVIEVKTLDFKRVEALARAENLAVPALATRLLEKGLDQEGNEHGERLRV